jgi:hypothetical protein
VNVWRVSLLGAAALFATGMVMMPSAALTEDGAGPANCEKYPVAETYSINSAGGRSRTGGNTGTVRVFGRGAKVMKVAVPPLGFDPHIATDAQLRLYGFPPRPAAGTARTRWNRLYPYHRIDFVVPEMCSLPGIIHAADARAGIASPAYSHNWSGGVATRETGADPFTTAAVRWNEPTFVAECPTRSAYSIWSGLGAFDAADRAHWGLLQTGVDNLGGNGPNDDFAWWEALNQNPARTLPTQVITNLDVSAADTVQAVTHYDPAEHSITFQIFDLTTNKLVTLGPWTKIVDRTGTVRAADDFYDGSSVELIAERPTADGHMVNLRKPSPAFGEFLDAELADGRDLFPGYESSSWKPITMVGDGGTVLSEPAGFPASGTSAWKNSWLACS